MDNMFEKEQLNSLVNSCQEEIRQLKKQLEELQEVIDKAINYIEKETRIYGLSMSIELGTHFDNILGILKEVK